MQIKVQVELVISIANKGCSVDELCGAIRVARDKLGVKLAEKAIVAAQHALFLGAEDGRFDAEMLEHHRRGDSKKSRCRAGPYISKGWRGTRRRMRTELGEIEFPIRHVMCKGCGKRFAPLLSFLSMRSKRHTAGLEQAVVECITADSIRPGLNTLYSLTGTRLPATTAHDWWATGPWSDVPVSDEGPIEALMADGTGFKGRAGRKGELKVAIGFTKKGRAVGLGTWAGCSWKAIGREIRKRIREQNKSPALVVTDGERDLSAHFAKLANRAQRCVWHGTRDLNFVLWEDGMAKEPRHQLVRDFRGILGIELPAGDWETLSEAAKNGIRDALDAARARGKALEKSLRDGGCPNAGGYVGRMLEKAFTHVEVWLETGIALPRTTSFLEGLMFKLGRRLKKIAWNWSDQGAVRMSRVLLKRILEPRAWQEWCKKQLNYQDKCFVALVSITVTQVTGFG